MGITVAELHEGVYSGSKFSLSPESTGQSCSESGSDCRAPGYPCSGRGNVCDYLLCKPPSSRRKNEGEGALDGKDNFDGAYVFVFALARGITCTRVCVCQRVRRRFLVKKRPVVNKTAGWELFLSQ